MSKIFTKILLALSFVIILGACGKKKKSQSPLKKPLESQEYNHTGPSYNEEEKGDEEDRYATPVELENTKLSHRMGEARVFEIGRSDGIGAHQIIYFPPRKHSKNAEDLQGHWYWKNADGNINFAYQVTPLDGSNSTAFEFALAPQIDSGIKDEVRKQGGTYLELSGDKLTITCGNYKEHYKAKNAATLNGVNFHPLLLDEDYMSYYQSPCSIYGFHIENPGNNDQPGDSHDQSHDQNQDNSGSKINKCKTSVFVKIRIRTTCKNGKCQTKVIRKGDEKKPACPKDSKDEKEDEEKPDQEYDCGQAVHDEEEVAPQETVTAAETTTCEEYQEESQNQGGQRIQVSIVEQGGQSLESQADDLIPYCRPYQQRSYIARLQNIEKHKSKILSLAAYCQARNNPDNICPKGYKIHELQSKIEKEHRQINKILNRCQERKEDRIARGERHRPEANTCGVLNYRRYFLINARKKVQKYSRKLSHYQALCETGQGCEIEKMKSLKLKIQEKSARVKELELKCNVR